MCYLAAGLPQRSSHPVHSLTPFFDGSADFLYQFTLITTFLLKIYFRCHVLQNGNAACMKHQASHPPPKYSLLILFVPPQGNFLIKISSQFLLSIGMDYSYMRDITVPVSFHSN